MRTGERQVSPTIDGIRRDHVARYEWAAKRLPNVVWVIDYACGVGYGANILAGAGHKVHGYDIDSDALKYADQHYAANGAKFLWGDGNAPHITDEYYAAVCFETIEHIEDPRPLLTALCKAAQLLIASVPNEDVIPYEYEPGKGYAYHFRHYTKAQFEALLNECGWLVTKWYGQEGMASEVEADCNGRTIIAVCHRAEAQLVEPKPEKIAIVGGAPSSAHFAPYDDPNCEIWVHGNQIDRHDGKRITRIFEIHDNLSEHGDPLKYAQMLVDRGIPMVVGEGFPIKAPHVEVYPFAQVNAFMGEHLTSTPAYMMGYAILHGATEILIYGCDMAVDDHEYFYQRPTMYAWIGYALGRGIRVSIPKASSLFKDAYVEGRNSGGKPKLGLKPFTEAEFARLHDAHAAKMREIEDQIADLRVSYTAHDGSRQAYEKMGAAARAVESGQVIETLSQTTVIL